MRDKTIQIKTTTRNDEGRKTNINGNIQIKKTDAYVDTVGIQDRKASNDAKFKGEELNVKREEMALKRELKEKDLQIAKENKNSFDSKKKEV